MDNIDELLGITTPATPATPAAASTPQASDQDRLDALLEIASTTAPAAVTPSSQVATQQSTPVPATPAPMDDLLGIPLASAPATPAGPSFMRRRRDQVARWIQGARDPARRAALLVAINPMQHASGRRITLRIVVVVVAILGLRTVVWHIERAIQHPPAAAQTTKPTPKPAPPRTVSTGVKATPAAPTPAAPVIPAPTPAPAVAPAAPVAQPAPVILTPAPAPAVAPTRTVSAAVKATPVPAIPAPAPTVQPPVVRQPAPRPTTAPPAPIIPVPAPAARPVVHQPAPHASQPTSSAAAKAAAAAAERALNSFFQPTQPKKTGGGP